MQKRADRTDTLNYGIPSHDAFSRIFRRLDPKAFAASFTRFLDDLSQAGAGTLAIDGKTLRRSFDVATECSPLAMQRRWPHCDARRQPTQSMAGSKVSGLGSAMTPIGCPAWPHFACPSARIKPARITAWRTSL